MLWWMPECCDNPSVPLRKLKIWIKTRFTFKVILFQKTLKFKHTIALCYGQQQSLEFQSHLLNPQVWAISKLLQILWVPWFNNVCWTKPKLSTISNVLTSTVSLTCQCEWVVAHLIWMKHKILIMNSKSYDSTCINN